MLGTRLRLRRSAAGLSQRELAARAGLSLAAVRDLEQGRTSQPRPESVQALVAALGLDAGVAAAWLSFADAGPAVEPSGPVWVGVLGPLTVRRGEREVALGGGRRRALLARLAIAAGTTVPVSDLARLLGRDEPHRAAAGAVQSGISRLRALLNPERADGRSQMSLQFVANGYRLHLGEQQSDLAAFRALTRRAAYAADPAAERELLTAALETWRGEPLADVPELRGHPLLTPIAEELVVAAMRHAELAATAGRPEQALPWLRRLTAEHPLHEPLHARLIRILAEAGRTSAALEVFDGIRHRLNEELGLDPGAELRDAHRVVLRGERPASRSSTPGTPAGAAEGPAQLPAGVRHFTGRHAELNLLYTLAENEHHRGTSVLIAITGTAGVGKTSLALHFSHRVRARFPDGQLYVDLRGFDPSSVAVSPVEAIGRFLQALGTPAARIPADPDAQAALLRGMLAGKRMLILLDNARDADQVRPLLPAGNGCLVVVTSRDPLVCLVATEGADSLPLSLLSDTEAGDLLAARLGRRRIAAEPDAVTEIIGRCARLPLALAIVAARAATTAGQRLAGLADELRDQRHRLNALATGSAASDVRSVFSWSYLALHPAAGDLFRLLGLHPGPEISVPAAASLAGLPAAGARHLLDELTGAHLLTEIAPGRFALHDLLRAYAHELVTLHHSDEQRRAATVRMLDHYLHTAHAAARLINPARRVIALDPPAAATIVEPVPDADAALAWFGVHHPVLRGAIEQADADGHDTHSRQLAWTLWNYLDRRGLWHELLAVQHTALAAALRQHHRDGQAVAHRAIARACTGLGRLDEAADHYRSAIARSAETGDQIGQATSRLGLARIFDHRADPRSALDEARRALALFAPDSRDIERAWALNAVGYHSAQLGEYEHALAACQEALVRLRDTDDRYTQAATWDSIGFAHRNLGDRERAEAALRRSIELFEGLGARPSIAETLTHLGDCQEAFGDRDAARSSYRRALHIFDDLGHPDAAAVRAKLG